MERRFSNDKAGSDRHGWYSLHDHATSVNPEYFPVIRKLREKGIYFCAASGRQYDSLRRLFDPVKDDMVYITENGTEIIYKGKTLFSMPMSMEVSRQLVLDTRAIPGAEVCIV